MKLLTNEIRRRLPALYATEHDKDPVAQVKFFSPWNGWTWYATEFDGEDLFFGARSGKYDHVFPEILTTSAAWERPTSRSAFGGSF